MVVLRGVARAAAWSLVGITGLAIGACPKADAPPSSIPPIVPAAPPVYTVSVVAPAPPTDDADDDDVEEGVATFYADMLTGRPTASGEKYRPDKLTCAHRTYELGTVLEITNTTTGKKARCRVNDRGPNDDEHLIDVSKRVARALDMIGPSVADVSVRVADDQNDPDQ